MSSAKNETLRFEALQYLAVDDFTLLTWRVTNLTDKTLFLTTSEFFAAFSGIEYDVCGGWQWDSLVLAPAQAPTPASTARSGRILNRAKGISRWI